MESKSLYKTRKVSQFHIDIVRENIDNMISGELNTKEMLELINKEATKVQEKQIKDGGTIKRIVRMLLEDNPEKLKAYEESLKHNIGKRTIKVGNVYRSKDKSFPEKIIKEYLPKLITGEITLETAAKELGTSHQTINKIIKEYYLESDNELGWMKFEEAKRNHRGTSLEIRNNAKKMRDEVEEYEIVTRKEFVMLSEGKQDEQILMKVRKNQLEEEKNCDKNKTALITEETALNRIQKIKEYLRSKNDEENQIIYFSEADIRYIIFVYPTILGRDEQTLDEKFEVLTSYDEIDEQIAYGMVKTFPAIIGYSADRTKEQLDLLKNENLIDYVISNPAVLMNSVGLMFALIEYAKKRHRTNDLSCVSRRNIFLANPTLKRLYGVTFDEIKAEFPYHTEIQEVDEEYVIDGQDVGKISYDANLSVAKECGDVLRQIIHQARMERDE